MIMMKSSTTTLFVLLVTLGSSRDLGISSFTPLLLPAAHAFHMATPPPRPLMTRRTVRSAQKTSTSSSTSTSSGTSSPTTTQKIREMATFLMGQLLEKTVVEAAKGEDSKITQEQALALMATLQQQQQQTKTTTTTTTRNEDLGETVPSDPIGLSTAATVPHDDDVPHLVQEEEADESPASMVEPPLDSFIGSSSATEKQETMETTVTVDSAIPVQDKDANDSYTNNDNNSLVVEDTVSTSETVSTPISTETSRLETTTVVTAPPVTETEDASAPTLPPPTIARVGVPHWISMDFGRPLEVEMYVPALRPSSIPKRRSSSECKSETMAVNSYQANPSFSPPFSTLPPTPLVEGSDEVQKRATETVASVEELVAPYGSVKENDPQDHESLPTTKRPAAVETKNKEMFQRTLLAARIAYDQVALRSAATQAAVRPEPSTPSSSFGRTIEVEKEPQKAIEANVLAAVFSMTEPEESAVNDRTEEDHDQVAAHDEEIQKSLLMTSSSVLAETEDVKVDDKELLDLADPYEGMSLEDKAFAVLSDLGMIQGGD